MSSHFSITRSRCRVVTVVNSFFGGTFFPGFISMWSLTSTTLLPMRHREQKCLLFWHGLGMASNIAQQDEWKKFKPEQRSDCCEEMQCSIHIYVSAEGGLSKWKKFRREQRSDCCEEVRMQHVSAGDVCRSRGPAHVTCPLAIQNSSQATRRELLSRKV